MKLLTNWLRKSIYRAILLSFVLVAVVPLVFISFLYTRQSMEALTAQMEENLVLLAQAKAEEINLKLGEVMHSTLTAAHMAEEALQQPVAADERVQQLAHYQADSRGIVGLDVYYSQAAASGAPLGDDLSNVYWAGPLAPDSHVAASVLQTEGLDTVFNALKSVSPDTQWIYLTTTEGMMRLYPWNSNDHYPDNWDPREIIFYTVAAPANNPNLEPRWTPPYVDYAGAGWMVTASVPMIGDDGALLGIMSHDVTIESIKQIALSIQVLEGVGYGFLVDQDGKAIAHPDFQDAEASKGTQEEQTLLESGPPDFGALVQNMVDGEEGYGYYEDDAGASLLVYAPIPETGWSLGISIPRENVIAPALAMQRRGIVMTVALAGVAITLAVLLTRLMRKPMVQLLEGVRQVSANRRADEIAINSFAEFQRLATAFNEMAARVWERERQLKAKVAEMRIEIDSQRRREQLETIVETDFFKRLEARADQMRENVKQAAHEAPTNGV